MDIDLQYKEPVKETEKTQADHLEQALENDIPEKYRGKSLKDVIAMHQEAEKEKSRLGNEVGEYRKVISNIDVLEQKKPSKTEKETTPVTTEELLENTQGALNKAVESNPVVQKAVSTAENLERQIQYQQFERDFPTFREDLANPDFTSWIQKSRARGALAAAASQSNDVEAARALWELWGEHKELTGSKAQASEEARKRAEAEAARKSKAEAAELEGGVSGDSSSEMIYDRQKLMQLRIRALRGDRVAAEQMRKLEPKLRAAYDAKRVR